MSRARARLAATIALLLATPAFATSGPGCFQVGNLPPSEPLMLRAGPSAKSEIVGQMLTGKHGIIAENGACRPYGVRPSKQWCPVKVFDGDKVEQGWARLAYLLSSHCP
jgi:hypothetical protein